MRDDQIDALLESLDDIAMRFDPYKSRQALDSQLREAVRSAIVRAQLAAAPVATQGYESGCYTPRPAPAQGERNIFAEICEGFDELAAMRTAQGERQPVAYLRPDGLVISASDYAKHNTDDWRWILEMHWKNAKPLYE